MPAQANFGAAGSDDTEKLVITADVGPSDGEGWTPDKDITVRRPAMVSDRWYKADDDGDGIG